MLDMVTKSSPKGFIFLYLYQYEDGFLFNSDAHFLYDFISNFKPKGAGLDVAAGCGIVGLLIARDFKIDLTLIEKQQINAYICSQNARVNKIKTEIICDDFLEYSFSKKFDYIVSNPPYYHDGVSESENISKKIGKSSSYLDFEKMVKKVNSVIKPKGSFIFCYDAKQLPSILQILKEKKFTPQDIRFVHGNERKNAHLVLVHAKKSSKALCKIYPPLINFINKKPTQEVKSIYQKTRTYSIKCKI